MQKTPRHPNQLPPGGVLSSPVPPGIGSAKDEVSDAMTDQPVPLAAQLRRLEQAPEPDVALPAVIQLRFVMLAGEAALLYLFGTAPFPSALFSVAVAMITLQLLANGLLLLPTPWRERFPQHMLGAVFALDIICFTGVLAASGGSMNPFTIAYLVQITLSSVLLHQAWTWGLGALATAAYGALFWLPVLEIAGPPHGLHHNMHQHLMGMWLAFVIGAALITFFIARVSSRLRRRQQEIVTLQRELQRQERLASLVTLAAGAAHEISTPLGTIAIAAREMELTASAGSFADDARLIRQQVERCRQIVEQMSLRGGELAGEALKDATFNQVLDQAIAQLPPDLQLRIQRNTPVPEATIRIPTRATAQALAGLLKNAIQASEQSQLVEFHASADGEDASFVVRDHGVGMDAATLARVAEPFFTTRPAGEGMGLGAYLAHLYAARMGGNLHYESVPGQGTTVTLSLPLNRRQPW